MSPHDKCCAAALHSADLHRALFIPQERSELKHDYQAARRRAMSAHDTCSAATVQYTEPTCIMLCTSHLRRSARS